MAKTSSTVRTTTIRMNGNPKQKAKSAKKGKPMSEKEKRKAAKAKAKAREAAARKAKRRKARARMWVRFRNSGVMHWIFTSIGAVAILTFFYYFFIRPYSYRWKPCYGFKGYGVCLPVNYKVHGIDVSHHQGEIDWEAVKATDKQEYPICFVFMKATEGGDHKDRLFVDNFRQAREVGLVRGAYHFYNPNTDPIRQADFFISQVKLETGDLAPVLDIERKPRNKAQLQADLVKFLNRLEQHYGVKPIIYTSYKYRLHYLDTPELSSYPLWIAHYYVDALSYDGPWQFWQHTDYGTVPGIEENVDLNVFNGSWNDLLRYTLK
ncbi:MAG: glycoside hydrolase family 25 protein [Bacteroidaceae bacterium]|nr:glycoside hydrolase family 25 protein [Bacteroidaceae bacterium]